MRKVDRVAMMRAIDLARQQNDGRREQIDQKLADEPWEEVGAFASYCCQDAALQLKPWQTPPCWLSDSDVQAALASLEDDHTGWRAAAQLVVRLEAAGLSKYEPDPITALERAEANSVA
jgi:hypothetical protein